MSSDYTAQGADPAADHIAESNHLHLSIDDPAKDNDTSEAPVREQFKKTSIAAIPSPDSSAILSDPNPESVPGQTSEISQARNSSQDETPSPISEPRGRLSRKRSYDDTIDSSGAAGEARIETSQDARKRSREDGTIDDENSTSPPLPLGDSTSEDNAQDLAIDRDQDPEIDATRSPRKKRSREEIDVADVQRGLKIAATDEAKAYRRSEDSERGPLPDEKSTFTVDSTVDEEQPSISESSQQEPVESASMSPEAPEPVSQRASEKAPTSFAASGFAAMSSSSKSPFGNLGASTSSSSSVFRSNSPGTGAFGATGSASKPSDTTTQTATSSAFGNASSSSPFLTSAATTTGPSGFSGFGANGAAPKPSGFGGSVFGSGFMNKGTAAPKLTSFAAPTGDLAPAKPTENTKTFGAQADDSAEEEGGSEGDATEEVGVGDDEVDSRFQQQEVETGEAGERAIFTSSRAQLYYFDSGGWHEKGKGAFKLNIADDDDDGQEKKKPRFIMRAHQTFRVLLNQPILKIMQVGDSRGREPSGKNFAFPVFTEGRPTPYLLKLSDENDSKTLYREVLRLQEEMEMSV